MSGNIVLWTVPVAGGVATRLTFSSQVDFYPACSHDRPETVFASLREGPPSLFRLSLDSPGSEVPLLLSPTVTIPTDWSRDGRLVMYSVLKEETSWDIELFSIPDQRTISIVATEAEERNARLAPDGRWIAYVSDEGGTFDVYVQPFPPSGARWQVSRGGGLQPSWSDDGRRLYYLAPDRALLSVSVTAGASGRAFGEPRILMDTGVVGWDPVSLRQRPAPRAGKHPPKLPAPRFPG